MTADKNIATKKTTSATSSRPSSGARHQPTVKKTTTPDAPQPYLRIRLPQHPALRAILYIIWTVAGFVIANLISFGWLSLMTWLKVPLISTASTTVLETVFAAFTYIISLLVVMGVPYLLLRARTTRAEIGLAQALPRWRDLLLAPLVYVTAMIVMLIITQLLVALHLDGALNLTQKQAIGFQNVTPGIELMLVYISLALMAPVAEEMLFRGYLFGKLRKYLPAWSTILLTAVVFGAMHLAGVTNEGHFQLQWNVMIVTMILAIGLGLLREYTGSIWAGIVTHMIMNSISFVVLFVLPWIQPGLVQ
jgi:membrane protease YdiL (CAAX protease family)